MVLDLVKKNSDEDDMDMLNEADDDDDEEDDDYEGGDSEDEGEEDEDEEDSDDAPEQASSKSHNSCVVGTRLFHTCAFVCVRIWRLDHSHQSHDRPSVLMCEQRQARRILLRAPKLQMRYACSSHVLFDTCAPPKLSWP